MFSNWIEYNEELFLNQELENEIVAYWYLLEDLIPLQQRADDLGFYIELNLFPAPATAQTDVLDIT